LVAGSVHVVGSAPSAAKVLHVGCDRMREYSDPGTFTG